MPKFFDPKQKLIFSPEFLWNIDPLRKYELLFSNLDASILDFKDRSGGGRKPVSKSSILRAFIYKNLKPLPTLSDLATELTDNPNAALKCGFDPSYPLCVERFSSFLKDADNNLLQRIRISLAHKLIELGEISLKYLSIDSCPILANVRENNLKTNVDDRFSKTRIPKGDPDSRLGAMVSFPESKKKIQYFWGYRNHVITDMPSELPIWEVTKPANVSEVTMFIPLFKDSKNEFNFKPKAVIGDSIYDSESILNFVIDDLKSKPYIAKNPRWAKRRSLRLSDSGTPICIAGFHMKYWGKYKEKTRIRRKFVCPITHYKRFRALHPSCPWNHPNFVNGRGCVVYLRGDKDVRTTIDYGSQSFKKIYNLRTGSERIFSRLLSICMQVPSVRGLPATANHSTIAHITVLLVALTAVMTKNKDKIRFIKNFLPNL